jgi:cation diffusion facilitator family transporter
MSPFRATALGLVLNILLAGVKLAAGVFGHTYALIADGLESLTDAVSSLLVLASLRYASKPPDANHPYGHGKAEALAALAVACLLMALGLGVGTQALRGILNGDAKSLPASWTLPVLIVVVIVKESAFRVMNRTAESANSTLVRTDAWHNRADAITSLAAAIGIGIAVMGGERFAIADDVAAVIASAIVLVNAAMLFKEPFLELMDAMAPDELLGRVRAAASEIDGVAVEKLRARKSGQRYFVDMHLHVDPTMTVDGAHALAGKVRAHVRQKVPTVADVLTHIEPASPGMGGLRPGP